MDRFKYVLGWFVKTWIGRLALALILVLIGVIGFQFWDTSRILSYLYGAGVGIFVIVALIVFGYGIRGAIVDIAGWVKRGFKRTKSININRD